MSKQFSLNDRVTHKDYPGTQGWVVALNNNIIHVLWDPSSTGPSHLNNSIDLPARTSRHIPLALQHV